MLVRRARAGLRSSCSGRQGPCCPLLYAASFAVTRSRRSRSLRGRCNPRCSSMSTSLRTRERFVVVCRSAVTRSSSRLRSSPRRTSSSGSSPFQGTRSSSRVDTRGSTVGRCHTVSSARPPCLTRAPVARARSSSPAWFDGRGGGLPFANIKGLGLFRWYTPSDWLRYGTSLTAPLLPESMRALRPAFERCLASRPAREKTQPPRPGGFSAAAPRPPR